MDRSVIYLGENSTVIFWCKTVEYGIFLLRYMMETPSKDRSTPPVSPGINWKYEFQQYGTAFLTGLFVFILLSVYLYFRRGYYDLYIVNKIFAGTSAILLGLILLIGPGSRAFHRLGFLVQYRKELGVFAALLAFAHGLSSYFFLPTHFSQTYFWGSGFLTFVFGLGGAIGLLFLLSISHRIAQRLFGPPRWWKMHYWGLRIVFLLTLLHVGIMKYRSWISWYQKGGSKELVHPEWPGAGLLVGWFLAIVLLIRVVDVVLPKARRVAEVGGIILLIAVYLFTFWWGGRFI
ncbi:hypothetical protein FJZ48_02290 [Candidatus Uhrbacteria bacterium]|nr:hypothetical protein [Candidatus Uhrbacteria bacterium]